MESYILAVAKDSEVQKFQSLNSLNLKFVNTFTNYVAVLKI